MFQVRYERKGLSLQSAFIVILLSAFYAKKKKLVQALYFQVPIPISSGSQRLLLDFSRSDYEAIERVSSCPSRPTELAAHRKGDEVLKDLSQRPEICTQHQTFCDFSPCESDNFVWPN